jgi:hypothetical protein
MRDLALGLCAGKIGRDHSRKQDDKGEDDDKSCGSLAFESLALRRNFHQRLPDSEKER